MDEFLHDTETLMDRAARAKSEADKEEELRKILLSELINHSGAPSATKAEHEARSTQKYKEATHRLIAARTEANILAAKVKSREMRWETWRSRGATERAKMNLR